MPDDRSAEPLGLRPTGRRRLAFLLPNMRGGGAERVALRLIRDFVAAGHEVDLVLSERTGELLALLPRQVAVFDLKSPRLRSAVGPLVRYFRERRPDAIQISMWPLTVVGIVAHRLARSRARVVVSDHTTLSRHFGHLAGMQRRLLAWSIRHLYPLADARVIVSRDSADDLARLAGLTRSSIEVIYNPIEAPPANIATNSDVESLWGGTGSRILAVGGLKAVKNYALLIQSFALVHRSRSVKLMILGDGELLLELQALAVDHGVANDVVLPGFHADTWPFYASANLFVLSSDYEGYPLVMVEAMRCGLPVVSTDCESGPREILDGGRYGALVPCGDPGAMANAIAAALDRPIDEHALMARADVLSGQSTSDRYLELMIS